MVDASLFDAIERARGDVARERWLRRAVERALGEGPGESEPGRPEGNADRAQARGQPPAPAEQLEKVDRILMNAAREFRPYPKGGKR